MTATVDKGTCTGCGLCVETCPGVFEMDGDVARAMVDPVPPIMVVSCREAADDCPVSAITIDE